MIGHPRPTDPTATTTSRGTPSGISSPEVWIESPAKSTQSTAASRIARIALRAVVERPPGQIVLVDVEGWDGEDDGEDAKFTFTGSEKPREVPDAPVELTKAGEGGSEAS